MVKCQSANQLKTPANVSWAFKMVSQFGSLGYTIMGKTADLTVVQKTIIETLHKEGKPKTFIAKEAGVHRVLYVSRNLATVVVRGILPGLRRRRTGRLPSGPTSSFQMRASFVFNLETKVLESGGRVEKIIAQVAWSPVLSFHSLWWFGVQCHLLVLVHWVFWIPTNVTAPVYQDILKHFMLPSADQLFKDVDFIFQQDLAPAHTAKST